ncbi:MAG: sugar phosphate isomerase/epimerase family protein [Nitrososphaerales archaeon]
MRIGISSYTYSWAVGVPGDPPPEPMTAADLLRQASELGVAVLQIADNLPLHALPEHELAALRGQADALGISIELGVRGIAPTYLRSYLRLAQDFGSSLLRVVVDSPGHSPDAAEVVGVLKQMMPEFERAGVVLAIENHDRFRAQVLANLIHQVGSANLGVCLDTVNSFGALEGPEVVLDTLGPLVVNVHVKDFAVVRASHQMGFIIEGRPAGEGQLNVPWLLGRLARYGRSPNLILEQWTPPEATVAETVAKERAWARLSIGYLRSCLGA